MDAGHNRRGGTVTKKSKPKRKKVVVEDTTATRSLWVVPVGVCIVLSREAKPSRDEIETLISSWRLPKGIRLEDTSIDPAYREVL